MRCATIALLILIGLCLMSAPLSAWEAIAHYEIGFDSGIDTAGRYENLPDSWPSHGGFWKRWGITEWFAWSHSVQLTGRTGQVPNQPVDASDKWLAGVTMYKLYRSGDVTGPDAYETALGFLTHVVQDQVVHYDYFRGGSIPNWREEHRDKERWADCQIYQLNNWFSHKDDGWDPNGKPLRLPKIDNAGNAELIARAQKEFIASGASIDEQGQATLPKAEDEVAVERRLSDLRANVGDYLRTFDREWCDQHAKFVKRYNWTIGQLRQYYEKAIQATKDTAAKFPR